ncbi:MAG: glycosyltransferase family 4 protein, partial [Planctomycetota bacterium]
MKIIMKIVLIPSSVELVGVSIHVLNLARLLHNKSLLEYVICPGEGWLSEKLCKENLPYRVVHISYKSLLFFNSNIKLFQILKANKSSKIVHLHGRMPLFASLLSMSANKHLRFVATIHQFRDAAKAGLFGWKNHLETSILRHGIKRIYCVSDDLKIEVNKRLGDKHQNKISVIKNWISPVPKNNKEKGNWPADNQADYLKIISVGRLAQEKGFDILIDAVRILTEKAIKIRCDIFGDGPETPNLTAQIIKYNLGNIIKLSGVSDRIRHILPEYDILVIPSRTESFGIVALEAYESGVPVIASNIPGLREIVRHEETGLLFEPGNAASLAFQISQLKKSPGNEILITQNARNFVKSFYPNEILVE